MSIYLPLPEHTIPIEELTDHQLLARHREALGAWVEAMEELRAVERQLRAVRDELERRGADIGELES